MSLNPQQQHSMAILTTSGAPVSGSSRSTFSPAFSSSKSPELLPRWVAAQRLDGDPFEGLRVVAGRPVGVTGDQAQLGHLCVAEAGHASEAAAGEIGSASCRERA